MTPSKKQLRMPPSADGSIYIPFDGPWQSPEDNEAYAEAVEVFNEQKAIHPYVALIQSHHEYSHGYWVEINKNNVKYPDHILKIHNHDTTKP